MLRHLALQVEQRPIRIDAHREQDLGRIEPVFVQLPRVTRNGERVQVDDAVDRLVLVLQRDPVAEGAEIVADVHVPGGLNAREHLPLLRHRLTPFQKEKAAGAEASDGMSWRGQPSADSGPPVALATHAREVTDRLAAPQWRRRESRAHARFCDLWHWQNPR